MSRSKRISAAIEGIDEAAHTPVHYPGAVEDPDTGQLISDAQVAETPYPLRCGRGRSLTVRLVVRRVKDARYPDALFPVWRHHPFVTNSTLPTAEADITEVRAVQPRRDLRRRQQAIHHRTHSNHQTANR